MYTILINLSESYNITVCIQRSSREDNSGKIRGKILFCSFSVTLNAIVFWIKS